MKYLIRSSFFWTGAAAAVVLLTLSDSVERRARWIVEEVDVARRCIVEGKVRDMTGVG